VGAIHTSIEENGFYGAVVVQRSTGHILAGNHRYRAVMAAEGYRIPVLWVDCDDRTAEKILLADNRTGELAHRDDEALAELLKELSAEDDLLGTGYDGDDLEALLKELDPAGGGEDPPEPQIDRAEELREKWGVEYGQLWQVGRHRILCGDSTNEADVARLLGGADVALVSDPPYGISVDLSWLTDIHISQGKPRNIAKDETIQGDDGTLDLSWCFLFKEWIVFGFPHVARLEAYTGLLVWDKRGDGGEGGLGTPVEVAASNSFKGYRLARHLWAGYVREAGETRHPHPTQKPVGIICDAIEFVKNANVLDPFLGSGTTLVACEQLNRTGFGMEICEKYVAVSLERLAGMGLTPELTD